MNMPEPKPGISNVTMKAIEIILERNEIGIKEYGTPLMTHNGRPVKRDLLEEVTDFFKYFVQWYHEEHAAVKNFGILYEAIENIEGLKVVSSGIKYQNRILSIELQATHVQFIVTDVSNTRTHLINTLDEREAVRVLLNGLVEQSPL